MKSCSFDHGQRRSRAAAHGREASAGTRGRDPRVRFATRELWEEERKKEERGTEGDRVRECRWESRRTGGDEGMGIEVEREGEKNEEKKESQETNGGDSWGGGQEKKRQS